MFSVAVPHRFLRAGSGSGCGLLFAVVMLSALWLAVAGAGPGQGLVQPSVPGPNESRASWASPNTNYSAIGTLQQRLACIQRSFPEFTLAQCDVWACSRVSQPFSFKCCVHPFSAAHTYRLLHDTSVMFVGDSTSRRAALQLSALLHGSADITDLGRATHHKTHAVVNTMGHTGPSLSSPAPSPAPSHSHSHSSSDGGSEHANVTVTSLWLPLISDLVDELRLADGASSVALLQAIASTASKRKVFVLSYSVHDLMKGWRQEQLHVTRGVRVFSDALVDSLVPRIVHAVTLLRQAAHVDPLRDIIIVRLPLAEACDGVGFDNFCEPELAGSGPGRDPINEQLARMHTALQAAMAAGHPDVGLVDLMSWTWAKGGVGRAECAPADEKGTHFSTGAARLAFVDQVLYAVRLLAVGRPEWPQVPQHHSATVPMSPVPK